MTSKTVSHPQYWYNGEPSEQKTLTLSYQDPGLLFGATVFTTLRVYEHSLTHPWTAWNGHIHRLTQSLQAFHWADPNWNQIQRGADLLARHYPVLRITLFPDGRELIMGRSLPEGLVARQHQGITAWVADSPEFRRSLAAHKTGNYLSCWLARQAAQRAHAQEAILIDARGHWLETSTGNLWGWARGQWYTPPLAAGILPGTLRSRLLQGLQAQQSTVQVALWTPELILQFTYLAYSSSVVEVTPIHTILQGHSSVNYNPDHEKTAQLTAAWR
ncbi:MAG: aminotransferase class IV [Leptolyngbyaceae cyanobacterium]